MKHFTYTEAGILLGQKWRSHLPPEDQSYTRQWAYSQVHRGHLGKKHRTGYKITQQDIDNFVPRKPGRPSLARPEKAPLYCDKCERVTVMTRTGEYWTCSQCKTAHPARPQPEKG
jgi:hypothetical protein